MTKTITHAVTCLVLLFTVAVVSPAGAQSKDDLFKQYDSTFQKFTQSGWASSGSNVSQQNWSKPDVARFVDMLVSNKNYVARSAADYPAATALMRSTAAD